MESIQPAYVAWRAGTRTLFLLVSWPAHRFFKNSSVGVQRRKNMLTYEGGGWSLLPDVKWERGPVQKELPSFFIDSEVRNI